jgi:hypothetical protein
MASDHRTGASHCTEFIVIGNAERAIECDRELFHKGKHRSHLYDIREGYDGLAVLKWATIKKVKHYDIY